MRMAAGVAMPHLVTCGWWDVIGKRRLVAVKAHSAILNRMIELEIYPVHGLLQVTFAPVDAE